MVSEGAQQQQAGISVPSTVVPLLCNRWEPMSPCLIMPAAVGQSSWQRVARQPSHDGSDGHAGFVEASGSDDTIEQSGIYWKMARRASVVVMTEASSVG